MIQFKDVSKVYSNGVIGVKDINFIIDEGEFVFLIGPSGSGKTTLIEMMIRDIKPTYGKIFFDDTDITRISRGKVYRLRRRIGVIFQDYKLVQEKTAYENVAFAMEVAGRKSKEINEMVPYVLEIVGLENRMDAFPEQLSGGEQQRVAIARAIANAPKLLIADEPTGNLDPGSAWDIVQILSKINAMGTTVLMSTHGTEIVNSISKRVIQMESGIIIRDDNEGGYEFKSMLPAQGLIELNLDLDKTEDDSDEKSDKEELEESTKSKGKRVNLTQHINKHKEISEKDSTPFIHKILPFLQKKPLPDTFKEEVVEDNTVIDIAVDDTSADVFSNVKDEANEINSEKPLVTELQHNKTKKTPVKKAHKKTGKLKGKGKKNRKQDVEKEAYTDSVDYLTLPKLLIESLKEAGYDTVGKVIKDGPKKINMNAEIDENEAELIAFAIETYLEDT